LYKALSKGGNPSLGTVLKVLKAPGLKLTRQVASASRPKRVTRLAAR
jgi:DNA-binding phage protein